MNISENKRFSTFKIFNPWINLSIFGLIASLGTAALTYQIASYNCQNHLCDVDKGIVQKELNTLKIPLTIDRKISSINILNNELISKGLKKEEEFANINRVRETIIDKSATEFEKHKAIDWLADKYENLAESSGQSTLTKSSQELIKFILLGWATFTLVFCLIWFMNSLSSDDE